MGIHSWKRAEIFCPIYKLNKPKRHHFCKFISHCNIFNMTDSATQSAKKLPSHEFLQKFPWVNFVFPLAKFIACARFRLFAHTKRDIAVAGRMRCGTFFGKGGSDRLSHCAKSVPSTHKKVLPFVQAQKISPLGIEPTTYGYFFRPMVISLRGWVD